MTEKTEILQEKLQNDNNMNDMMQRRVNHNPLHYQMTDYDCGPMTFINGIESLFGRDEIMPEVLRYIVTTCTESVGLDGHHGTQGTSREALAEISRSLHDYGRRGIDGAIPVDSRFIIGESVSLTREHSEVVQCIERGGVALIHVFLNEIGHYLLLTGLRGKLAYLFDPYFVTRIDDCDDIIVTLDHPCEYNRILPISHLEEQDRRVNCSMGPVDTREAVLMWRIPGRTVPDPQQRIAKGMQPVKSSK